MVSRLAVLVAAAVCAAFPAAIDTPASAAELPIEKFGACMSAGGDARVLLLMDTSASLKTSDPGAARVDAANHLVDRLGDFANETKTSVEIAVASFSVDFDVTQSWTDVRSGGRAKVEKSVDKYRDFVDGWETDYWNALQGAREYLAEGESAGSCTALVWFTDGMYDLDFRDTAAERQKYGTTKPYGPGIELVTAAAAERLERLGANDLCRPGGVADALRADGVTTLAIGLRGGQANDAFALMRGVATGSKVGGSACGERSASGQGSFVLAGAIGDLFFAFDALADPENVPSQHTSGLCQREVCDAGTHRFAVDRSISAVSILGGADLDGFEAVLVAPGGERHRLTAGEDLTVDEPGYDATARWLTDTVFTMEIVRGQADGWDGQWGLAFVDPRGTGQGTARSSIRLASDLVPSWTGKDQLIAGKQAQLDLGVALSDGTAIDPSEIDGAVEMRVSLDRVDGTSSVLADGISADDLRGPVDVNLAEQSPGTGTLRLSLTLTTAPAQGDGTRLEPRLVGYPVTVEAPGEYPRLPGVIEFGRGDSTDAVTASVKLDGPGCVWLVGKSLDVTPVGVKGASLTSPATDEATCADEEVELSLQPDTLGAGLLGGTATFAAQPGDGAGEAIEIPVRFRYEMQRPADEGVRWLVFIVTLLLGVAIPALILAAIKRSKARFADQDLAISSFRGPVRESDSFLDHLVIDRDQQELKLLAGRQRERVFLTDRVSLRPLSHALNPLTTPDVAVEPGPATTSNGARLPLAVQRTWIVALDAVHPHDGDVEVILVLPVSGMGAEELLRDAREQVPGAVARLRSEVEAGAFVPEEQSEGEWGIEPSSTTSGSTRTGAPEGDEW